MSVSRAVSGVIGAEDERPRNIVFGVIVLSLS